jgi:hypothetical protein
LVEERIPKSERDRFFRYVYAKRPTRIPPSRVFPGLNASLDERIIRDGRDKDVPLCTALAGVKQEEQREFYERFLVDVVAASRWVRLPKWQRPIMLGDAQDRLIWKVFTILRLNMELTATSTRPWEKELASQGQQLVQLAGLLSQITDTQRLGTFLAGYGALLAKGQDVGDPTRPPWTRP